MHDQSFSSHSNDSFLQGIKDCIPTLIGYISIGFAFGVVGIASNLSIIEIFLISFLIYAGSAQFIFCGLLLAGAPFSTIVLTVFIVNLRHLLMSFSLAPYFTKNSILQNIGYGTLLTDETYGVASMKAAKQSNISGSWMNGLNCTAYIVWIISCTMGGVLGQFIKNPEEWGLDYALVAMFIALLVLTLHSLPKSKLMLNIKLIAAVVVIMYLCTFIMPGHLAVLVSTIIVATIGVVIEK